MHALTLTVKKITPFVLCINFQISKVISFKWLDKSAKENTSQKQFGTDFLRYDTQSMWTETCFPKTWVIKIR